MKLVHNLYDFVNAHMIPTDACFQVLKVHHSSGVSDTQQKVSCKYRYLYLSDMNTDTRFKLFVFHRFVFHRYLPLSQSLILAFTMPYASMPLQPYKECLVAELSMSMLHCFAQWICFFGNLKKQIISRMHKGLYITASQACSFLTNHCMEKRKDRF